MPENWRASADVATLQARARMLRSIRAFFAARDVMELETPLLAGAAVTDLHLASMRVDAGDGMERYLNTSPEYCMKRFVAEHGRSVYQVCKCFRAGEAGPAHNPEFSMLEWYRVGFDLDRLMAEVEDLLVTVFGELGLALQPARRTTYRRLFEAFTGLDPHRAGIADLHGFAVAAGLDVPAGLSAADRGGLQAEIDRDAWLDWLLSCCIAPGLDRGQLTFISDFPVTQAALARVVASDAGSTAVARRFEVYFGATELANGYDELLDAGEQTSRFARDNSKRVLAGLSTITPDRYMLAALAHGLPSCAGVAVGLDRLLCCLPGISHIAETLSYDYTKV